MRYPDAARLAANQDGVISRRQLYALGLTRWQVKAQLRADRWRSHGRQTIAVHTGRLDGPAQWWRAVWEVGADAALDGVTALQAAGLDGFHAPVLQVSVSRGSRYSKLAGVRVYETRRRKPEDVLDHGLPRVRPEIAAVRAALWAVSNRQAALLWLMPIQQRILGAEALSEAFASVKRHRRRSFLRTVLADLVNGVQSMGELDFARMCRARGLPEPTRQVVRRGPDGRIYLDVYWDQWGVVVEIEGAQHLDPAMAISDALRQNHLFVHGDGVLRIPVIGLRLEPDAFMNQVARLLARCRRAAAAA
jgi:very-short-patch-repair endonuclease